MTKKSNFGKIIIITAIIMGALTLGLMLLTTAREQNNSESIEIDLATMELVQLNEPKEGDPVAIVETSIGEVRFRLYPEYSPNAVNNFISLAESGYYDDTYVFNAQHGAYSSLGAPNKDGSVNGSFSDEKEHIERELHQNLWPFRGAVCMMNNTYDRTFKQRILGGGTYYNGSRFNIVNSVKFDDEFSQEIRDSSMSTVLAETFIEKGGIPNFSQQLTIIGQTYAGFDVVDKLASLESQDNGKFLTPKEDVKIINVKIDTFKAGDTVENSEK